MARSHPAAGEKPLHWVGSSKKDLLGFPGLVTRQVGIALGVVQRGGRPPSAKPWKGLGPDVLEIVEDDAAGTYRAVYTVRFAKASTCCTPSRRNRPPESGRRARISG